MDGGRIWNSNAIVGPAGHPAVAHLPIGAAVFLVLWLTWRGGIEMRYALLYLSVVLVLAAGTGWWAYGALAPAADEKARAWMDVHRLLGFAAAGMAILLTVAWWEAEKVRKPSRSAALWVAGFLLILVLLAGWSGGRLVYEFRLLPP